MKRIATSSEEGQAAKLDLLAPHPVRDAVFAGTGCFLVGFLCIGVLYRASHAAFEHEARVNLLRAASAAAAMVDGDLHRTFKSPDQEGTPEYEQALKPLRAILNSNPDVSFVYTMAQVSNRAFIVLDSTPRGDADNDGVEDHSPIMQPYNEDDPEMMDALRHGRTCANVDPVRDEWGSYLSAYAPFYDSNGDQAGVVGIDIRPERFEARLESVHTAFVGGTVMDLGVSLVVGLAIWRLRRAAFVSRLAREEAITALDRSEITYRTLVENTPDAIARVDTEGRCLFINGSFLKQIPRDRDAALGKTHREMGFPEGDCEAWERSVTTALATRQPVEIELETTRGDRPAVFNLRFFPEQNSAGRTVSVFALARDITAHRTVERDYRVLVGALSDAMFVHGIGEDNVPTKFIEVNEEACRRLGYTREELLNMSPSDVDDPDSGADVSREARRLRNGEAVLFEQVHVNRDGRRIPVEVRARAFMLGGKLAIISIVRDITERKKAEEERQKVQEQLQQAQKLEGLGLLAGGIAHDFNNLLMAILGNADLAMNECPPDSAIAGNLREIKVTSTRAAELCRQMLAYSGRGSLAMQTIDLSALVQDMTNLLKISTSKKSVLHFDLEPGLPWVKADASQMRQVVMNLVINASEAIGDKSGIISIGTGLMECDADFLRSTWLGDQTKPGVFVFLEVTDTGCGMDWETMQRIFDPFFTTKFAGRGLGLAAVMGVARGHKGAVNVKSAKGKGSVFRILLPVSDAPHGKPETGPERREWKGSGTILIVEDEETVRTVTKRLVERMGFSAITAADGREAAGIFRDRADELVCVITDLTMPHMDGKQAFIEMRKANLTVPIVLASGYSQQDLAERFAGEGWAGFIQKPYQFSDLVQVLRGIVEKKPPQ